MHIALQSRENIDRGRRGLASFENCVYATIQLFDSRNTLLRAKKERVGNKKITKKYGNRTESKCTVTSSVKSRTMRMR